LERRTVREPVVPEARQFAKGPELLQSGLFVHDIVSSRSGLAWNSGQEVLGSVGHPKLYVWPFQRVEHPSLTVTPMMDPPSEALVKPQRVNSRNAPNFSIIGF